MSGPPLGAAMASKKKDPRSAGSAERQLERARNLREMELEAAWGKLNELQRAFVDAYLENGNNAAAAARAAGYNPSRKTAKGWAAQGKRVVENAKVAAFLRLKSMAPERRTKDERISYLTRMAFGLPIPQVDRNGITRSAPAPVAQQYKAQELLARLEGELRERVEVTHAGSVVIQIPDNGRGDRAAQETGERDG